MKVYPFIIRNFFQSAVTLVTGGASGLGFACVQRFIKQGSRVVLVDLPDSKGGQIAEGLGQDCLFAPADVSYRLLICTESLGYQNYSRLSLPRS